MPENLLVAVRFAFDLFLKATLLLALTMGALLLLRRTSAAVRQLVATLGLAGSLALPVASLFAPRWEIPLFPNPLPAPVAAAIEPVRTWKASALAVRQEMSDAPVGVDRRGASGWTAEIRSARDSSPAVLPEAGNSFEPGGVEPKASSPPAWWMLGILALWSAGTLLASTRLGLGAARVARIRRRASEVDESWTALADELASKLGVARTVRLLFSADVAVPVTTGARHPVILLPDAARRWNEERRRVVLLHELAHVRRADWPALLIAQAAAALYWFHPLAWSARIRMQKDCERACDDLVLASGTRASVYAAHLLSIIRSLRLSRQRMLPAVAMAHRSYWDGRMRAILDPAVARRVVTGREARIAAAAILTAVAALAVFEPWAPECDAAVVSRSRPAIGPSGGKSADHVESDCPIERAERAKRASLDAETAGQATAVAGEVTANVVEEVVANVVEQVATGAATRETEGFTNAGWKRHQSGGDWYSRGMDFHNDGHYDEAIAAFGHSIEEGHRVDASMYNIACGYALKGDADRAIEWLRRSLDEGFDLASYIDRDDDLDRIRSDPRFVELRRNLRSEKIAAQANRAGRLARRFGELQASSTSKGSAFYGIGKELLEAGQYDVAAKAFQESATRGYRQGTSLYNSACALSLAGNRAAALDLLAKSLDAGFDDVGLFRRDDDLDNVRGEPRYRELLKRAEDLKLHRFNDIVRARSWTRSGLRSAWRETEQHFAEYAQRHSESGRAWFNLGYARIEGDRPEAAVEAFQRALDLRYRPATTMYNLACAYSLMDRKDDAFAWLFKALDAGFDGSGMIRSDDDLDNLRGDPRYRQALSRVRALEDDGKAD